MSNPLPFLRSWFLVGLLLSLAVRQVVPQPSLVAEEPPPEAPAEEPGLPLLDRAMEAKISAHRLNDLDLVISLCQEAITSGLSETNVEFANEIIAATQYEKANRLVGTALAGQLEPSWTQRRAMAQEALAEALKRNPDDAESHLLAARIDVLPGGDAESGLKHADRAIELLATNPPRQSVAYLARSQFQEDVDARIHDLDRAIELEPKNFEAWRERGRVRLISGKVEEAVQDFLKILEMDDKDVEALDAVARALAVQQKYDEALAYVDRMMALDDKMSEPHALRASIRIMQEMPEEALKDLNAAIELAPSDLAHRLSRARLLESMNRGDEALQDIDRVLELRPGLLQAMLIRTSVLVGQKKYDEAAEVLKSLVRLNADNVDLQLQLASLYVAAKKPRTAIKIYDDVIATEGPPWEAYRGRADAYLGTGDHAKAIADYEKALEVEPEDSGLLNNLAWVLATSTVDELRDGARAIDVAAKACDVTEYKQAHILSTLAAGYAETGDFDKAIEWSTKAVELGEGDMKEQLQAELESYRQKKPWREMTVAVESEENLGTSAADLSLDAAEKPDSTQSATKPERIPADP